MSCGAGQAAKAVPLGKGRVVAADNIIKFESVPLVTPNGDVLVQELSFEVVLLFAA